MLRTLHTWCMLRTMSCMSDRMYAGVSVRRFAMLCGVEPWLVKEFEADESVMRSALEGTPAAHMRRMYKLLAAIGTEAELCRAAQRSAGS